MKECEHATSFYIDKDAPITMWPDGSVRHITYTCHKCNNPIYQDHPWEKWKVKEIEKG